MKSNNILLKHVINPLRWLCIYFTFFSGLIAINTNELKAQYFYPAWTPPYYIGARYYYIPDIETYYDIPNQQFIYHDNGRWKHANTLPPVYSAYDLFNGFFITLATSVYQPWVNHYVYVNNYPRYFYRVKYNKPDFKYIRGFNENIHQPYYWKPGEKERVYLAHKNNYYYYKNPVIVHVPQHANNGNVKFVGPPAKVKVDMKAKPFHPSPSYKPKSQGKPNPAYTPKGQYKPNPAHTPKPQHKPSPSYAPKGQYKPSPSHTPKPQNKPSPSHAPKPQNRPSPSHAPMKQGGHGGGKGKH